jgi:hypothetical protein
LDRGPDCFVDFLDEVSFTLRSRKTYEALLSACQCGVGRRILKESRHKQDGNRSWLQLVNNYETESNRNISIKRLENVAATVYYRHYRAGLLKWIKDYEDAFNELVILGEKV